MPSDPDLITALRAALRVAGHPLADAPLRPLPDSGLAHAHVALAGTGVLARIPKQSQLGLAPEANLAYQRACFERAHGGGHAPRLHGWLAPSELLPRGALLVEHVQGRRAVLPAHLPAIAGALAGLHRLPLPPAAQRPPLLAPADPLRSVLAEIEDQAMHLDADGVPLRARAAIRAQLALLHADVRRAERPPVGLVAFDSHPGNFLVREDGRAILVDLEKCRYGHAGLDLAHATLYTSTTWDVDSRAVLGVDDVLAFHAAWAGALPPALAAQAAAWHLPLRRAMWLWSLTWCAKWQALCGQPRDDGARGEDWSAEASTAQLVAHVRERVGHYLSPVAIDFVRHELDALARAWAP